MGGEVSKQVLNPGTVYQPGTIVKIKQNDFTEKVAEVDDHVVGVNRIGQVIASDYLSSSNDLVEKVHVTLVKFQDGSTEVYMTSNLIPMKK
jgi:hypothetical protein